MLPMPTAGGRTDYNPGKGGSSTQGWGTYTTASPNLWDSQGESRERLLGNVQRLRPTGMDGVELYNGKPGQYQQAGYNTQLAAMDMYGQAAMGQGPSVAQAQLAQGYDQAQRGAMGLMGQTRGGNLAGAYGQTLGAQSGLLAQTNQQSALLRAQEIEAARAGYAGIAGQMSQTGAGLAQAQAQYQLGLDQNELGWYAAKRGMDLQQRGQDRQFFQGLLSAGVGAAGGIAGAAAGGG